MYSIKDLLDLNETSYRISQDKRLPEHLEAVRALVPVSGGFILGFLFNSCTNADVKRTVHTPSGLIFFQFMVKAILFQILQLQEVSNRLMDALPQNFVNFIEILNKIEG